MGKPNAAAVAARAIASVAESHTYAEMDCQAFVEHCVVACGGVMAYTGSNDMARNALCGLWPLTQAKQLGKVVAGAGLFIHAQSGGEPAKYRADGLGDYNHVGLYVGNSVMLHCGDPISYTNLNSSYWQQHFYCYGRLP